MPPAPPEHAAGAAADEFAVFDSLLLNPGFTAVATTADLFGPPDDDDDDSFAGDFDEQQAFVDAPDADVDDGGNLLQRMVGEHPLAEFQRHIALYVKSF